MPAKQTGGISVTIDPQEWYRLKTQLDAVDKSLARNLRLRIKNAGNIAAENVKATLRLATPDGNTDLDGREALINATKVSVGFSARTAGAKIVTSSSGLPEKHKGLLKVYNMRTFRHPVFESSRQGVARGFAKGESRELLGQQLDAGDIANWVQQEGRPYFGAAILKVINTAIYQEIADALTDAVAAIGGKIK